ncbi:type II CAAX endopeptidase family protein [Actinomycetes bacterium KLBMP 9759]
MPAQPPRRTHRWGIGAYVLVEIVFLGTSFLLALLMVRGEGEALSAGQLALSLAVPTTVAATLAVVITLVRGNGPFSDLRLSWSWRDVGVGLAFGFGGLFVTIPASIVYSMIVGEEASSAVGSAFAEVRADPVTAVAIFATVALVAPLCEEIVYRGLLWGSIERLGVGPWIAFGVTTLLFALAHFEFTRTPLLLIVAIPIALARVYTGRLLASIVAHQVNNLLPALVLVLGVLGALPVA